MTHGRCPYRIPHACGGEPYEGGYFDGMEDVFPTRVGVNRQVRRDGRRVARIPHACGGEPVKGAQASWAKYVFPTRVGVNRLVYVTGRAAASYSPRVWG